MKKKSVQINFNLSNRMMYTLIALTFILVVGVGVYAFGTSNPGNFGHSLGEINLPSCSEGQLLGISGGSWNCIDTSPGIWSQSGSDIYYNSGNVGIGINNPSNPLEVCKDGACVKWVPTVGNYGADTYSNPKLQPAWYSDCDTCGSGCGAYTSDYVNKYTCSPGESRSCIDIYESGGGGPVRFYKINVVCKKETRLNQVYSDEIV